MPAGKVTSTYNLLQALAHGWWCGLWLLVAAGAIRNRIFLTDQPEMRLLVWMVLLITVTAAPFTIQPRYHMPMVPMLLLIAGFSLASRGPSEQALDPSTE